MLSKCANPECSTRLLYLREGKVFQLEVDLPEDVLRALDSKKGPRSTKIEHFWLCGPCSKQFTLRYEQGKGVSILPRYAARAALAS